MAHEKLETIWIPLSYKQLNLGNDDVLKHEALKPYDGKFALINDICFCSPECYLFVKLKIDSENRKWYYVERINHDGKIENQRLNHSDLEGVLVESRGSRIRHEFSKESSPSLFKRLTKPN